MNGNARKAIAIAAPFGMLALAACVSGEPAPPAAPGNGSLCDPARSQTLVGSPRVTDEEARQRTGAGVVRQIRPGDPVTMDFLDTRVTIATDPATGIIRDSRCG